LAASNAREAGYVCADLHDHLQIHLANGAGHTFFEAEPCVIKKMPNTVVADLDAALAEFGLKLAPGDVGFLSHAGSYLYKSLFGLTDDVIWHWRSGGLSVVCITSDLFVTGELRSIEEGLHRGLAEAVASLMGAVFIVFCEPEVKVGLQLVD